MKLRIDQVLFEDFDLGCKILKLKYKDECPLNVLKESWDSIVVPKFSEIALLRNLEQRRIGIKYLGIEGILKEVKPKLIDKSTISKSREYIDEKGKIVVKSYDDTYELFKVDGKHFSAEGENRNGAFRPMQSVYYVRCKDTSTDREYMIWVDMHRIESLYTGSTSPFQEVKGKYTAIQAIAWTITTRVPAGDIEKIIRQGDCILVKPKGECKLLDTPRHLTSSEYRELLVNES